MYTIDKTQNRISLLNRRSFLELGIREKQQLQEWIVKAPDFFGEELLIIQRDFSGFSDSGERLDLLALDREGDLVIIENRLDGNGVNLTWQALKFSSYCSKLSRQDIAHIYQEYLGKYFSGSGKIAEESIVEFFGGNIDFKDIQLNRGFGQRIILVSTGFKKDITSTVLWLLNYRLKIQCFKVTPFEVGGQFFLDVEQIIPVKETEEYISNVSDKNWEYFRNVDLDELRKSFWSQFLEFCNKRTDLFKNVNAVKAGRISVKSGKPGVDYQLAIEKFYGRIELFIDTGERISNIDIYEKLYKNKASLESKFGSVLSWERCEGFRECRVVYTIDRNCFERTEWEGLIHIMINKFIEFENTFRGELFNNPIGDRNF